MRWARSVLKLWRGSDRPSSFYSGHLNQAHGSSRCAQLCTYNPTGDLDWHRVNPGNCLVLILDRERYIYEANLSSPAYHYHAIAQQISICQHRTFEFLMRLKNLTGQPRYIALVIFFSTNESMVGSGRTNGLATLGA